MRGLGGLFEEFGDLGFGDRRLRSGDPLDAVGGVHGTPGLNQAAEGVVGGKISGVRKGLFGDGAGLVVAGEQPFLDTLAVVGNTGGDGYRVLHNF